MSRNVKWSALLHKAYIFKLKSRQYLHESVYTLMKQKGFSDSVAILFNCDFAGGNETIIKFNNEGEMSDLDLRAVSGMEKEEIISIIEPYLSIENKKLINMKEE